MVDLVGPRLVLREFAPDDWPQVHAYACREDTVRHLPWGPNQEEDSREFVARSMAAAREVPRPEYTLAVTTRPRPPLGEDPSRWAARSDKARGLLIGGISLTLFPPPAAEASLGYCLHPDYWGRGFATEAARLMIAWGFQNLGLKRIGATCDEENQASWRVLEKLGAVRTQRRERDRFSRGCWHNTLVFSLAAQDWRQD